MAPKTHISYLDTIRGLAALAVISEHFVIAYGLPCETPLCQQLLDFSPLHIWWDGSAAVSMFFVLSGVVLSLRYFRAGHIPDLSEFHLARFLINRMFRIWLPYLLVLLISTGLFVNTFDSEILRTSLPATDWITGMWHKFPLTPTDMLRESFLLKLPALIVLLPQAWTLSIELVLSLLLPVGLLLAGRGTSWLVFFGLLATSLLGVSIFLLHFLLGMTIARHYTDLTHYLSGRRWQRRLLLLAGLAFYTCATFVPSELVGDKAVWLGSGLGAGLILMFVLGSKDAQRLLSQPVLRQIGKVSYSAYLSHMAILICLTPLVLKFLEGFTENRLALWFGGWLITIACVQGVSLLFYHWLEIPSMRLGRRVTDAIAAIGTPTL
ncbi:acyltransferase family protein [Methylomonas methanica]|uniref:Acyltransferase 3 domain-containing protein n=1 Tax=Methylomonas methanica TaxID=421 RepID=A0A177MDC1_METMH|nr:acyltransferase [Methylomonas methanica]OAI03746.1 hypothetical protein A1332_15185 [Methylomonas methanica]